MERELRQQCLNMEQIGFIGDDFMNRWTLTSLSIKMFHGHIPGILADDPIQGSVPTDISKAWDL